MPSLYSFAAWTDSGCLMIMRCGGHEHGTVISAVACISMREDRLLRSRTDNFGNCTTRKKESFNSLCAGVRFYYAE
jgi:hypothetical protein